MIILLNDKINEIDNKCDYNKNGDGDDSNSSKKINNTDNSSNN